jgi:hypothetical protein
MGAVTFSIDGRLVQALKSALPLSDFVETGTFKGDTTAAMLGHFERLYTVELSEKLWRAAVERFGAQPNVTVALGDSPGTLANLQASLQEQSALYWLDAHWCLAEDTSGARSQCPLLQEIGAINKLNTTSVVLIDDARLFLATPQKPHESSQWPRFHEIVMALFHLSADHEIMVVNDVIVFFPKSIRAVVENYARDFGTDWLVAMASLREQEALAKKIQAMDKVIQELHLALKANRTHAWIFPFVGPLMRTAMRTKTIAVDLAFRVRQRLGGIG